MTLICIAHHAFSAPSWIFWVHACAIEHKSIMDSFSKQGDPGVRGPMGNPGKEGPKVGKKMSNVNLWNNKNGFYKDITIWITHFISMARMCARYSLILWYCLLKCAFNLLDKDLHWKKSFSWIYFFIIPESLSSCSTTHIILNTLGFSLQKLLLWIQSCTMVKQARQFQVVCWKMHFEIYAHQTLV